MFILVNTEDIIGEKQHYHILVLICYYLYNCFPVKDICAKITPTFETVRQGMTKLAEKIPENQYYRWVLDYFFLICFIVD